jgi:hypothetical protein
LKGAVGRIDRALYWPAGAEVSENYNLIQAAKRVPKFQIPMYYYERDATRGELYEHDI